MKTFSMRGRRSTSCFIESGCSETVSHVVTLTLRCFKASHGDAADDSDPDDDSGLGIVQSASAQPGGPEVGERTEDGGVSVDPDAGTQTHTQKNV